MKKQKNKTPDLSQINSSELYKLSDVQKRTRKEAKELLKQGRAPTIRRIGGAALEGAALTVGVVEVGTRLVAEVARRVGKSAKSFPEDVRKVRRGLEPERFEPITETSKNWRYSRVGNIAMGFVEKRWEKRKKARNEAWSKAGKKVKEQFHEEHPEIRKNEAARNLSKRWTDAGFSAAVYRTDIPKYFKENSLYSFSKLIPRRPKNGGEFEGEYSVLARQTLESAMKQREDSNKPVMLLSTEQDRKMMSLAKQKNIEPEALGSHYRRYGQGAAALLWQMDFIKYESDDAVSSSRGTFNSDIEWSSESHDTRKARIPFDETNELHLMLAGDETAGPGQRFVEVSLHDPTTPHYDNQPYMNIQVVQDIPEVVAA